VITFASKRRGISRLTQGHDDTLSAPQLAERSLSHRRKEIAIDRELLPRKSTMSPFAPGALPNGRRV